ncbi:hypothetical protein HK104_003556 [Borealophlyctis nickersoniae]|nr:hypothetical protein HK104_003556 [Borealophlyctis nickersoniae]
MAQQPQRSAESEKGGRKRVKSESQETVMHTGPPRAAYVVGGTSNYYHAGKGVGGTPGVAAAPGMGVGTMEAGGFMPHYMYAPAMVLPQMGLPGPGGFGMGMGFPGAVGAGGGEGEGKPKKLRTTSATPDPEQKKPSPGRGNWSRKVPPSSDPSVRMDLQRRLKMRVQQKTHLNDLNHQLPMGSPSMESGSGSGSSRSSSAAAAVGGGSDNLLSVEPQDSRAAIRSNLQKRIKLRMMLKGKLPPDQTLLNAANGADPYQQQMLIMQQQQQQAFMLQQQMYLQAAAANGMAYAMPYGYPMVYPYNVGQVGQIMYPVGEPAGGQQKQEQGGEEEGAEQDQRKEGDEASGTEEYQQQQQQQQSDEQSRTNQEQEQQNQQQQQQQQQQPFQGIVVPQPGDRRYSLAIPSPDRRFSFGLLSPFPGGGFIPYPYIPQLFTQQQATQQQGSEPDGNGNRAPPSSSDTRSQQQQQPPAEPQTRSSRRRASAITPTTPLRRSSRLSAHHQTAASTSTSTTAPQSTPSPAKNLTLDISSVKLTSPTTSGSGSGGSASTSGEMNGMLFSPMIWGRQGGLNDPPQTPMTAWWTAWQGLSAGGAGGGGSGGGGVGMDAESPTKGFGFFGGPVWPTDSRPLSQ